MTQVDDWLVDTIGGHIFLVSTARGFVNVFDLDGVPIASIRNLASPTSVVACNGTVYLSLYGSGEVVRVDSPSWTTQVVTGQIARAQSLACAGAGLYALSYPAPSVSFGNSTLWRVSPGPPTPLREVNYSRLAPTGTNSSVFAYRPFSFVRLNISDNTETVPLDFVSLSNTKRRILQFYPGESKFISMDGARYDASSMLPDGLNFGGRNAAVSQTSNPYVAIVTNLPGIVIYDGNSASARLNEFPVASGYVVQDVEFAPGTRDLYALIRDLTTLEVFLVRVPDILTG